MSSTRVSRPPSISPLNLLIIVVAVVLLSGGARGLRGLEDFPNGFLFGTASSAYQYEGAASEDGRGASIWDTYTHLHPEGIADGSNGDVAVDSYHRYKEDVQIIKYIGMDAYRFSISWSRILPNGSANAGVNEEGVKYYNNLIDELLDNGIQPFATLFHWDSPQALEDKYGGFRSPNIVEDFEGYARVCFREFGDRVKHWFTFNEPHSFSFNGYGKGNHAPGRCSSWFHTCDGGDSAREPYIVAHHMLLSHARAVRLYRAEFQERQKGEIGIVLNIVWFVPFSDKAADVLAAQRSLDFLFGWFMDPLVNGNYPPTMTELVGDRLPKFTDKQSEMLKGSFDFLGINYYTSNYAYDVPPSSNNRLSLMTDSCSNNTGFRNGISIGPLTPSDWLYVYPEGIKDALLYTKQKYNDPIIYITENGVDEMRNGEISPNDALDDGLRIRYYQDHLQYILQAIRDGVKVKGYFAWSLLDNFEWAFGYTDRFGLVYVDYEDGLKRYPKTSALWFREFLLQSKLAVE